MTKFEFFAEMLEGVIGIIIIMLLIALFMLTLISMLRGRFIDVHIAQRLENFFIPVSITALIYVLIFTFIFAMIPSI